jgi:hypothetical protein
MEQLRRKNKFQRLVWIFKGGNIEFEVERERERERERVKKKWSSTSNPRLH